VFSSVDELIQIFTVNILSNNINMSLAPDSLAIFDDLRVRNHSHYLTLIVED
jgi:anthranilate/para-aminobenzoate synthase component I